MSSLPMKSIKRWLLGWLMLGFVAASAAAGYGIFRTAREEAAELFDYELRAVAVSLPHEITVAQGVWEKGKDLHDLSDDRIVIGIWDSQGRMVFQSGRDLPFERFVEGFRTIERKETHWRIFGLRQADRFIEVAQPVAVRDVMALRLALRTLWPLALLLPVTIALVLVVVSRGFVPVGAVSRGLSTRSLESLEPLSVPGSMPVEIRPLVDAVNDLLARLKLASEAQRTFVADAAHELRSPLAALKLQLQAAVRDGSVRGNPDTIARIEARLNRLIHLVQQLLALAREDAQPVHAMHPVSLRRLAQQAVGDFSLLAEEKEIDLGVEFAPPTNADDALDVLGEGHALTVLLNNLLDNAIRYTPRGGRVDVVLRREGARIGFEVCDSGPGIAEDELARVCDRFYRALGVAEQGSGLGLAIVSRIVKRHRGSLTLRNREDGGLAVSVHGLTAASLPALWPTA